MSRFRKLINQLVRFGAVGVFATALDMGGLWVLTEFAGVPYLTSGAISFTVSMIVNYLLSVAWVFDVRKGRNKTKDFLVFILMAVVGLGINQLVLYVCVEYFGLFYMVAKVIATAVVMVYNFISRKLFLENTKTETSFHK